jgi:hypothetical protein
MKKTATTDTYYEVTNEDSGALKYICTTRIHAEKRAAELTRKSKDEETFVVNESTGVYMPIEKVKKGDYFKKRATANKVWRKSGYCRYERKYTGDDMDDISNECYLKKGTLVYVDFTY